MATGKAHYYGRPLTVEVKDGQLVVAIGIHTLAHAVTYSEWANPYQDEAGDYYRTFAIADADTFAREVREMMLAEREDGSSLLTDFLDKASEAAVDDGSQACEYEQRIPYGRTAPVETWSEGASRG